MVSLDNNRVPVGVPAVTGALGPQKVGSCCREQLAETSAYGFFFLSDNKVNLEKNTLSIDWKKVVPNNNSSSPPVFYYCLGACSLPRTSSHGWQRSPLSSIFFLEATGRFTGLKFTE
jgi:hypothetical protein